MTEPPDNSLREIRAPLHRVRAGLRIAFQAEPQSPRPTPTVHRPARAALGLALGHRMVAEVERGEVEGFSALGRRLGLHPARVSILVSLTFLAPDLQAKLIESRLGEAFASLHIRDWVSIARDPRWDRQREQWLARCQARGVDPI